ncbi:MAG: sulfite exporter TauE/SafE family protein [Acidobacteria bacterium]|nr:sulfite exporter TauE/SafE family protein [Acidobacteriota bacterium]
MADSLWSWTLLSGSAFMAGVVNSIAGGGTLLTFPSLLAVLNPVQANATSTLALLPGSLAAGWGYRREVVESRDHLMRLWPPSFVGGIIGSLLVIRLPERVFAGMVPWLLVLASVLMLLQRPIQRWLGTHKTENPPARTVAAVVFFQFLVGVYGGYFGAGIGILMLSSLAFVGIPDIHRMNAVKSLLAATMNGVTVVIFAYSGVIVWRYAVVMALAATAGGFLGARVARKTKPDYVRAIVILIGFAVAAYSFLMKG